MKKKIIVFIFICLTLVVGYYFISPIFITIEVNDSLPNLDVNTDDSEDDSNSTTTKIVSAPVIGSAGHPASGEVKLINTSEGKVIRYENFETINGPDLYVYLSKDLKAIDFVSLGEIRATKGNVNYTIPDNIDLGEYKYVMTWCKQFGVLFNYADISILE